MAEGFAGIEDDFDVAGLEGGFFPGGADEDARFDATGTKNCFQASAQLTSGTRPVVTLVAP